MPRRKRIYIAGPLFSDQERRFLEDITSKIADSCRLDAQRDIFLPHRDAGDLGTSITSRRTIFEEDLANLKRADVVISILDGADTDSGTAFEMGYAFAKGKHILGILSDRRKHLGGGRLAINNMIWGSCSKGARIFRTIDEAFIKTIRRILANE